MLQDDSLLSPLSFLRHIGLSFVAATIDDAVNSFIMAAVLCCCCNMEACFLCLDIKHSNEPICASKLFKM